MDDRLENQDANRLLEYVRGLKKPLLFVARNEFANLGSVRDLDRTLLAVIERALELEVKVTQKELLREIRLQFLDYENLTIEEKREAVGTTLGYLRALERQL